MLNYYVICLIGKAMRYSIGREFGLENVTILRKWEQLEKKIADFKNHRRFTLRCLSQKITPNSLKLKSNIKTSKGKRILERAEKATS